MAADSSGGSSEATVVLVLPGWHWRSYTGVSPGSHALTVMLGGNSRTVPIDVEAGRTYEIPLKFGGRWGALEIEFPEQGAEVLSPAQPVSPET